MLYNELEYETNYKITNLLDWFGAKKLASYIENGDLFKVGIQNYRRL